MAILIYTQSVDLYQLQSPPRLHNAVQLQGA